MQPYEAALLGAKGDRLHRHWSISISLIAVFIPQS